jgi:GPI ethanolamine phosphate transferase 1
MVAIGVLYLIFEKKLLSTSKLAGDSTAPADNALSRSLVGIQVRYSEIDL